MSNAPLCVGQRLKLRIIASILLGCMAGGVSAADYPDRPVRVIVSVQPGGTTDTAARVVGQELTKRLGQPFLIENKPGAGTRIGTDATVKAKADGYTIGLFYGTSTLFQLMFDNQSALEPGKDFEAITMLGRAPSFLAVNAALPIKTVPQFIAYAREKNGKITFGHSGTASQPYLGGMILLKSLGVTGVAVPYKGNGPTAVAIASGEIDFSLVDYASVRPMVERGAVRLIAINEPKRSALRPDVPTTGESGITRTVDGITPWFFFAAPSGTPPAVIATLNKQITEILKMPDVLERLHNVGVEAEGTTPAEASAYFLAQREKLTGFVKDLGISLKN